MGSRCIATASDARYFPALIALLRSLKRTNPGIPVIVFDGGLSSGQAGKAARFAEVIKKSPFMSIPAKGKFGYLSDATLLKFEVAELDHDKVLSLDADTVVLESLDPLFSFPERTVGVVPEVNAVKHMFRLKHREKLMREIDIDWHASGFNAGLFALRPAEWRDLKDKARGLIERFGREIFSKSKDQQLLNVIFSGRTCHFPRRYNFSPFYDKGEVKAPAVIHYLTGCKPWHGDYPAGCCYREFRKSISVLDHPSIVGVDVLRWLKYMAQHSRH